VTNLTFSQKCDCTVHVHRNAKSYIWLNYILQLIGGKRVLWNYLKIHPNKQTLAKVSMFQLEIVLASCLLPHVVCCPLPNNIMYLIHGIHILYECKFTLKYCLTLYRITWDSTRWKGILFSGPLYH
jgi:hypothetical protein